MYSQIDECCLTYGLTYRQRLAQPGGRRKSRRDADRSIDIESDVHYGRPAQDNLNCATLSRNPLRQLKDLHGSAANGF